MEEQRPFFDLTILSASDLKRGWLSGDQIVAVAWINPSSKKITKVSIGAGIGVQWHETLRLPLEDAYHALAQQGKLLTIEIRSRGALGNNLLGTAFVPFAELVRDLQNGMNSIQTYQLVLPSGKRQGSVSFLAKFVKPLAASQAHDMGTQVNALYPPLSQPSVKTSDERPLCVHSVYPTLDHSSYGLACNRSQLYPPVNTSHPFYPPTPLCTPSSNFENMGPYAPFSSTPYPALGSMYPQPFSPVVHPPPPRGVYPPAPHHAEIPYPAPSLSPYPYSHTHASPVYPPLHSPQCVPPHSCSPYCAY